MLWSAASFVLAVLVPNPSDLTEAEMRAWKKVQPSVVQLVEGQRVRGYAALVSREGFFIAHVTAVDRKTSVDAKKDNGSAITLKFVAKDEPTQLVLLKADDWSGDASPIIIASSDAGNRGLLALSTTGPVRAERSYKETYGIVDPSNTRRVMPLNELYLENNLPTLGGSLLFDLNGQFAGVLNAALGFSESQALQKNRGQGNVGDVERRGGSGAGGGAALIPKPAAISQFGPGIMTAAYTIRPKVLRRVVEGFLSEGHVVKHPAIGVFCKNALPQGALIDSVTKGSPADKAGLLKDDIIVSMNNEVVKDQIDFARIMADQEVGGTLKIWIQRAQLRQLITVEIGS